MTSNYVSHPVLETNQLSQHSSSYVLTSRLCLAQFLSQADQCISCFERLRRAVASEQHNTSKPMFKPVYKVFVYSLSAWSTNWMIILHMTCVNNFSGIYMLSRNIRITFRVFYCKALSDHLLTFLQQTIISADNQLVRLFINQSTDDRSIIFITMFRIAVFKQRKRKYYIFLLHVLNNGISPAFLPFRSVDAIVITDHDLFWNVGQANCI